MIFLHATQPGLSDCLSNCLNAPVFRDPSSQQDRHGCRALQLVTTLMAMVPDCDLAMFSVRITGQNRLCLNQSVWKTTAQM